MAIAALASAATICTLLMLPSPATAAEPVWLCKPGIPNNPCATSLRTTVVSPSGQPLRVRNVQPAKHPKVDCFYVYPTVTETQPQPVLLPQLEQV